MLAVCQYSPVPDSCCCLHLVVTAKSFGVVCQGKVLAVAKGEDAFCATAAAVTGMRAVSCQSRLQQSSRLHWQLCTKGCTVEFTELFVYDRTRHLNVVGSCLEAINWLVGKSFPMANNIWHIWRLNQNCFLILNLDMSVYLPLIDNGYE